MLPTYGAEVQFLAVPTSLAKEWVKQEYTSAVGHEDTAALFSNLLGTPVVANRINISLGSKDRVLVGQYTGPRLPEGTTVLPEGAHVKWWIVTVVEVIEN